MPNDKDKQNILIIGLNWLGDAVMSLPAIQRLHEFFPDGDIYVLCRDSLKEVYRNSSAVTDTLPFSTGGKFISTLKTGVSMRKYNFKACVVLPRSWRSAVIAYLSLSPVRIGYKNSLRELLLTGSMPRGRFLTRHRVEYYTGLLSLLGADAAPAIPQIAVSSEAVAGARARLQALGTGANGMFIGFCPGAVYGNAKRWLPERYAELAKKIITVYNAKILIFGNTAEKQIGDELAGAAGMPGSIFNLAGTTGIGELAAMISLCRAFVTNDTGAMHIAAAVGVPVAAVFGPTDPVTTSPYGNGHIVISRNLPCAPCLKRECPAAHECMEAVTVDEVYDAVQRILTRSGI
ncbi:MAG: lipopolysaccharide heptosyltransferase II [Planctomycetes bacterium]|nr:lipopolysaccharide heptosyltransferase II [Planctomycetota bacterium]